MKIIANSVIFQSTPPRGWRPDGCFKYPPGTAYFNPLHHEGGDHVQTSYGNEISYFNPLHHEGGDASLLQKIRFSSADFNPLHHEGGDTHCQLSEERAEISIHSTTRVETIEATYNTQPTVISIHSTTRVETIFGRHSKKHRKYFNPLHHEGGDGNPGGGPDGVFEFQSTPPRGWRPCVPLPSNKYLYFNPLHHEGGDVNR